MPDYSMPKESTLDKLPEGRKSYGQGLVDKKWDFELSSGALVQLREPNITDLMSSGILDMIDPLTGQVKGVTIPTAEGKRGADTSALLNDTKKLNQMLEMIDTIVLKSVVQPKLFPRPVRIVDEGTDMQHEDFVPDDELDPEKLYIHQIDIGSKSEIMEEAMSGMKSYADFRPRSDAAVDGVSADGENAPASTPPVL